MALEKRSTGILKQPGNVSAGPGAFEGVDHGKGMDDIAHRAKQDNADAGLGGESHDRGNSSRHSWATSVSDQPSSPSRARLRRERRRRARLA